MKSIKLHGSDLSRVESIDLKNNTSQLAESNAIFGKSALVGVQQLSVSFEALGEDASFCELKSLRNLKIASYRHESPVRISSHAFHGLHSLEDLEISFSSGSSSVRAQDYCNNLHKSGTKKQVIILFF